MANKISLKKTEKSRYLPQNLLQKHNFLLTFFLEVPEHLSRVSPTCNSHNALVV